MKTGMGMVSGGGGGGGGAKVGVRVVKLAVLSRILVLGLFLLWRILASPYDTSATLNPPCLGDTRGGCSVSSLCVNLSVGCCLMFDQNFSLFFSCVVSEKNPVFERIGTC